MHERQAYIAARNALYTEESETVEQMDQEIVFISGKGGVGKSTLAAALAFKKAQQGKNTLLIELGDYSYYKDFFNIPSVEYRPTELRKNLSVALWTGKESLREYAQHLLKVESLYKLFFENAVSQSLINIAPGLTEMAILGKITSGIREIGPPLNYDCLIIDAFATGHFLSLLGAPQGLANAIKLGPMGVQSREIDKVIRDSNICKTYLVCLPEEMPVRETEELAEKLRTQFSINANIVMNKIIETNLKPTDLEDEGEFGSFMIKILERQTELTTRLQKIDSHLQALPLVMENDPWHIVEKLAERLK